MKHDKQKSNEPPAKPKRNPAAATPKSKADFPLEELFPNDPAMRADAVQRVVAGRVLRNGFPCELQADGWYVHSEHVTKIQAILAADRKYVAAIEAAKTEAAAKANPAPAEDNDEDLDSDIMEDELTDEEDGDEDSDSDEDEDGDD